MFLLIFLHLLFIVCNIIMRIIRVASFCSAFRDADKEVGKAGGMKVRKMGKIWKKSRQK